MEPFLGEIRIFAFGSPPRGWARCDGRLLPISSNAALFSILGTTYGGDGRVTFALPDLRGRVPLHPGMGNVLGSAGGAEAVALTPEQYVHEHAVLGQNGARTRTNPAGAVLASGDQFGADPVGTFASGTIAPTGTSAAHENMPPVLALQFCIAVSGIYPSRS